MEQSKIHKIVEKLLDREEIFRDRKRLNDGLGLNGTDYLDWDVKLNTGVYSPYAVLSQIVTGWASLLGDRATIAALQSCLREMHFRAAADSLEGIHEELTGGCTAFKRKHTNHIKLDLPTISKPDASFTGRTGLIDEIINHLTKRCNKDHSIGFPLVVLYALGGFGKTQLCRKIVLETRKNNTFTNFIWITAEFEDGIQRKLYNIARDHLQIEPARSVEFKNFSENDFNKLTITFYSKLQSNGSLIIFDNVESFEVLKKYLPLDQDQHTDVSVLVTSRRKWDDREFHNLGEIENISVSLLTQSDALDLVTYMLPEFGKHVRDKESVQRLIETSGRIPLLLNLMASTIANMCDTNRSYSIAEYLEQSDADNVIDACDGDGKLGFQYEKNLRQCVTCSVKCLEGSSELGNLAKITFDYFMYCDIESVEVGVILKENEQIIKQASSIGIKMQPKRQLQQVLREALSLLGKFSLIEPTHYNGDILLMKADIHRLVQEANRKALSDSGMEEAILKEIMDIYGLNPSNELRIRFGSRCRAIPKIWSFIVKYPDLVTKYYQKNKTLEYITVHDGVGTVRALAQNIGLEKLACDLEQSYLLRTSYPFVPDAMRIALLRGKVDIANFFITCGAIGKSSICRDNWLYLAVKHGPLDILRKIMNHFVVDVDHIVPNDVTDYAYWFEKVTSKLDLPNVSLLEIAAAEGMLPILKYLLDNGANYLFCADLYKFVVMRYKVMEFFLDQPGFDLKAYEHRIGTSFICQEEFWRYNENHIKSVELLIAHGSSPPWVFHPADTRTTILHYAAQFSDDQCVKHILDIHPGWLEVRDKLGNTPLIIAVRNSNWHTVDIVELLLVRNADVNAYNSKGKTALMQAVKGKYLEVVKVLLENRADVNIADRHGDKPIHYALISFRPHEQIIQMLVAHGANIYATGNEGRTILHKRIQDENVEPHDFLYGVEFLVHSWPRLCVIRNDDGLTPLELAQIKFANLPDNFKAKVFKLLSSPSE